MCHTARGTARPGTPQKCTVTITAAMLPDAAIRGSGPAPSPAEVGQRTEEVDGYDEGPPHLAPVHLASRPGRQIRPCRRGERQLDRCQRQDGGLLPAAQF